MLDLVVEINTKRVKNLFRLYSIHEVPYSYYYDSDEGQLPWIYLLISGMHTLSICKYALSQYSLSYKLYLKRCEVLKVVLVKYCFGHLNFVRIAPSDSSLGKIFVTAIMRSLLTLCRSTNIFKGIPFQFYLIHTQLSCKLLLHLYQYFTIFKSHFCFLGGFPSSESQYCM